MPIVGEIAAIFRYPVKSMRGESLDAATLGWHGIAGDRRCALQRRDDRSGMPFLTASKLPELVLFTPHGREDRAGEPLPAFVRTPGGEDLPLFGEGLAAEIERRCGVAVEMTHLRQGVFDEASMSVISSVTIEEVCRLGGEAADMRRFRPNVVVRPLDETPFGEDAWVSGVLTFGEGDDAAAVTVTQRDVRCAMVNIDPDDGRTTPEMLKAVVRVHENCAGVYGTVTRTGDLAVGQKVMFRR